MGDESDGGRKSARFAIEDHRSVSYGPSAMEDRWVLGFNYREKGRIELHLNEETMYDLWVEVQDVPYPRDGTEAGGLRREIVRRTREMDAEMLEEVLGCVEEAERR